MTIGEFSQATRLSLKALRIYHEEGLLVPEEIDHRNGYRKYGDASYAKAQSIILLKELGFSLKETAAILGSCADDGDVRSFLEMRLAAVEREIADKARIRNSISFMLETQRYNQMKESLQVEYKDVDALTIVGIRYMGRYDECGERFSQLYRSVGRFVMGPPFCLYYAVAEEDGLADIEACLAVRKAVTVSGAVCRVLPAVRCLSVIWRGPYEGIGEAYRVAFDRLHTNGGEACIPSRELYLKGPGMIIPRSPKRYVTEIQIPIN